MPSLRSLLRVLVTLSAVVSVGRAHAVFALDNAEYCHAVQNRVGLIRYPLGTVGVSSTDAGEIADVMTLVPRVYPCLNTVTFRAEKEDWRDSVGGDPSHLIVKYKAEEPCGASMTEITVTPHVSVFRVTFPAGAPNKQLVLDFSKYRGDDWAILNKWTQRSITRIDGRTIQATVCVPSKRGAYYAIRFSTPCTGFGTLDASGIAHGGARSVTGEKLGMYARFAASSVTVVVAESFTSMNEAEEFLAREFLDFDTARQRCRQAWNDVLNRVEIVGSENSKRMAYTSLYSMYVNIIDGGSGSRYSKYYPRP